MARIDNYKPQPGGKNPSKYPFVGANYNLYGEQPGFIYDPYSDGYYADPRARQQQYEAEGLIEKPKEPPGLVEQLLPVGLAAGALYAGKGVGETIGSEGIGGLLDLGGSSAPEAAGAAANLGTGTTQAIGSTVGSNAGVASAANGGTILADGTIAPVAAEGGGGMLSLGGIGSAGNVILPAAGAFGAYDLIKNDRGPGRGAIQGAASGAAIGSYFGLPGAGIGAGIGGLLGLGKGLMDHKTTKEYQQERWGNLANSSDPGVANYAKQYQQYLGSDRAKQDGQYENTYEGKKAAGTLKPEDVWGGIGVMEQIGPEWLGKATEEQRRQASQRFIDEDLIRTDKGDMYLKDPARGKQILAEVMGGKPAAPPQQPVPQAQPGQATGAVVPVPKLPLNPANLPVKKPATGLFALGSS